MNTDTEGTVLHLSLGTPGSDLDLMLVEQLAETLRGAFETLLRERTGKRINHVQFILKAVSAGSLNLTLEPRADEADGIDLGGIAETLIADINSLASDTPRQTMGSGLVDRYRALVGVARKAGRLELRTDLNRVTLDPPSLPLFDAALKEEPEPNTRIIGVIESLNIHRKPWTFGLYTKLDQERVVCRFAEPMLEQVLHHMETGAQAEVVGEGRFGPVGLTPRQLDVLVISTAVEFSEQTLLSYHRSSSIVRAGENSEDALARVREETAPYA